jgi:hypothetical protein
MIDFKLQANAIVEGMRQRTNRLVTLVTEGNGEGGPAKDSDARIIQVWKNPTTSGGPWYLITSFREEDFASLTTIEDCIARAIDIANARE